jgi:hypothetical protein
VSARGVPLAKLASCPFALVVFCNRSSRRLCRHIVLEWQLPNPFTFSAVSYGTASTRSRASAYCTSAGAHSRCPCTCRWARRREALLAGVMAVSFACMVALTTPAHLRLISGRYDRRLVFRALALPNLAAYTLTIWVRCI